MSPLVRQADRGTTTTTTGQCVSNRLEVPRGGISSPGNYTRRRSLSFMSHSSKITRGLPNSTVVCFSNGGLFPLCPFAGKTVRSLVATKRQGNRMPIEQFLRRILDNFVVGPPKEASCLSRRGKHNEKVNSSKNYHHILSSFKGGGQPPGLPWCSPVHFEQDHVSREAPCNEDPVRDSNILIRRIF